MNNRNDSIFKKGKSYLKQILKTKAKCPIPIMRQLFLNYYQLQG